jgi:hypothetical protein
VPKEVYGTFRIKPYLQLRVSIEVFPKGSGRERLDIRLWSLRKGADRFTPTVKGVRIPRELTAPVLEAMLLASRALLDPSRGAEHTQGEVQTDE